jgi:hypothetical protein
MKGSFIGKKEIDEFLDTIDGNKDNSLFRHGDQERISLKTTSDSESISHKKIHKEVWYR